MKIISRIFLIVALIPLLCVVCAPNIIYPKFYIFPFYKMYLDSTSLRRAKENHFNSAFKTQIK